MIDYIVIISLTQNYLPVHSFTWYGILGTRHRYWERSDQRLRFRNLEYIFLYLCYFDFNNVTDVGF